jgi:hypothetical protein
MRTEVDDAVLLAADGMVDAIDRILRAGVSGLSAAFSEAQAAKRAYLAACEEEDRRSDAVPWDIRARQPIDVGRN